MRVEQLLERYRVRAGCAVNKLEVGARGNELRHAVMDRLRRDMAAHTVEHNLHTETRNFHTMFSIDAYVIPVDELHRVLQMMAMDLERMNRQFEVPYVR